MARKTKADARGLNKSEAIRAYLATNPTATPTVVRSALRTSGIAVSIGLVSAVKYRKATSSPLTRRRRGGRAGMTQVPSLSVATLLEAKRFAGRVGGVDRALEAIRALQALL